MSHFQMKMFLHPTITSIKVIHKVLSITIMKSIIIFNAANGNHEKHENEDEEDEGNGDDRLPLCAGDGPRPSSPTRSGKAN